MKRHASFVPLSHEHHDGLLLATRLQQGPRALLRMWSHDITWQAEFVVRFFDEHLEKHFRIEEEILFPVARPYLDDHTALIDRLLEQHRIMRSMVEFFRHPNHQQLTNSLAEFGAVLEDHIHSEERELFPLCEERMPESGLITLGRQIRQAEAKED